MQLILREEEREALLEVLSEALGNLCEEVYKTENFEYRETLKHSEAVIKNLLIRLGQTA